MLTRKDLLQAHRLGTQRAALALISGEPDDPERPLRRMNVATFSGIMVAVIVAAAFGVIGLVRPGGATGLDKAGMLIIEKETGRRYVWCLPPQSEKLLCPVANYVSARLLAGKDDKSRRTVSANSLTKFQRGVTIGIPGAPDTVPDADDLVKTPWSVCARAVNSDNAGRISIATLLVGSGVGGRQMGDAEATVVQADGQPYLIWRNKRMRVPSFAVSTLGVTNPPKVAPRWITALPQGTDYAAPEVSPLGGESAKAPNGQGRIGQVFNVKTATGDRWFVLLSDGLAQISEIEKELMLADPATKEAYGSQAVAPIPVDASTANGVQSAQQITKPDLQAKPPRAVPYDDSNPLCAVYDDPKGNAAPKVTLGGSLPPASVGVTAGSVDLAFPPGGAAVVGLVPGPGKADQITTYYLVTEDRKFAFKAPDIAKELGYELPGSAAPVQAGVLNLIPSGPVLDPAMANTQMPSGGSGVQPAQPQGGQPSQPQRTQPAPATSN